MSLLTVRGKSCWWNLIQSFVILVNCDGFIYPKGVITDPCDGDSGGPLAIMRDGRWQLVGVLKVIVQDFPKNGGIENVSGRGLRLRKGLVQRGRPVEQRGRATRVGRESVAWRTHPRCRPPQLNSACLVLLYLVLLWFRWVASARWNWRGRWRSGKGKRLPWWKSCLRCWLESGGCSCCL